MTAMTLAPPVVNGADNCLLRSSSSLAFFPQGSGEDRTYFRARSCSHYVAPVRLEGMGSRRTFPPQADDKAMRVGVLSFDDPPRRAQRVQSCTVIGCQ